MYVYRKIVSLTTKVLNIMCNRVIEIKNGKKVLRISCKYFTIFSLIATLSTNVTRLLQCKGIHFYVIPSDVMFDANVSSLISFL